MSSDNPTSADDQQETSSPLLELDPLFRAFATIVGWTRRRFHLTPEGFEKSVRLAYAMNANGRQRRRSIDEVLGSSETARWAPTGATPAPVAEDTVRSPWRHGESGRNDLTTSSHVVMTE